MHTFIDKYSYYNLGLILLIEYEKRASGENVSKAHLLKSGSSWLIMINDNRNHRNQLIN